MKGTFHNYILVAFSSAITTITTQSLFCLMSPMIAITYWRLICSWSWRDANYVILVPYANHFLNGTRKRQYLSTSKWAEKGV